MKFNVEIDIDWIGGSYQDDDGEYHNESMSINDAVKEQLTKSMVSKIESKISSIIDKAVKDKINYSIDALIDDTLRNFLDRQIKITDKYGTVKATYENVEEMLCEKFDEFILQKVDGKGQPQTGCTYGNGVDGSRIAHLISNIMTDYKVSFNREIKHQAENIAKTIKTQISNKMDSELQTQITEKVFKALDLTL